MPRTVSKEVYEFNELNERAKEKAREWWREGALDHEWWEHVLEDAKRMLAFLGFDFHPTRVYWSDQGPAYFDCTWSLTAVNVPALMAEVPQDSSLHSMGQDILVFTNDLMLNDARLSDDAPHCVIEAHERRAAEFGFDYTEDRRDLEKAVEQLYSDACGWIHSQLRDEEEYQLSDEVADGCIEANGYLFNEDGSRA